MRCQAQLLSVVPSILECAQRVLHTLQHPCPLELPQPSRRASQSAGRCREGSENQDAGLGLAAIGLVILMTEHQESPAISAFARQDLLVIGQKAGNSQESRQPARALA